MKIQNLLLVIVPCSLSIILSSCGQSSQDKKSVIADSPSVVANTVTETCYLRTEGLQSQDSLLVHLVINGDQVSGKYSYVPSEKDSRRGTLSGTKKGDIISATWTYMQEGSIDSLPVEFRFTSERIYQRNAGKVTGYESSSSTASTERRYDKVTCN